MRVGDIYRAKNGSHFVEILYWSERALEFRYFRSNTSACWKPEQFFENYEYVGHKSELEELFI